MKRLFSILAIAVLTAFVTSANADDKPDKGKGQLKGKLGNLGQNPEAIFKRLDANNDGKVTKEEFKAGLAKLAENAPALKDKPQALDKLVDKIFERLDANCDGSLTLEELKKFSEQ